MTKEKLKIFSPGKVNFNSDKIRSYLKGEKFFPITIELDLTQLCTRSCPGCPYSVSRRAGHTLQMPFLDRLFSILGQNTEGIVFSGGESTIVPHFPQAIELAHKKGFKQIAVISNGANIQNNEVQEALLKYATSIRISMYDWHEENSESFIETLKKIEAFQIRKEKEGSKLEISASLLTRKEWNNRFEPVGLQILNTGVDWLYFHPYCIDWDKGCPIQADQTGVLDAIDKFKKSVPENANIQVPEERYNKNELYFEKLHGSHFLIQVGADGINYAGPESKYEDDAFLLNLNEYMKDDFLWHNQRTQRLDEINSDNYRYIGTKHRPPIFSDYIQKLIELQDDHKLEEILTDSHNQYKHPNIV